ncbi:LacI family DNA-binding transcriptional regulator [Microbacterium sp. HJ5]
MPAPTIYDVARVAGVSKSLVSLVLQGSDRVSDASRRAVEEAIRELGYRPSRAASDLAARRTKLVGVLIDDYANPWFVDLLRGLHHVLGSDGFRVTVIDTATTSLAEDPVEGLLSMRADGIVVARDVPNALVAAASPPVVIAGTRDNVPPGIDAVANDDVLGAQLATDHLLGLGHRVIGHLSATGGAAAARRRSFVDVTAGSGARAVVTDYSGPATEHAGYDGTMRLLADHPEVTAIFAANDVMAIGALGAARDRGIDVPGQLSIVGYDNTLLARTRLINLTTVDDNGFGVGREAGRILRDRMSGAAPGPRSVTLPPALVTRGTTAAVP